MVADYSSQLDALNSSYAGNLADFQKYYVLHSEYPADQTYSNFFENAKKNLQTNTKDLFLINNNIQNNINYLQKQTDTTNSSLTLEKNKNNELLQKLAAARMDEGGAKTMIYDYKNMYRSQYISNATLFLGIFIAGTILVKTYRIKPEQ